MAKPWINAKKLLAKEVLMAERLQFYQNIESGQLSLQQAIIGTHLNFAVDVFKAAYRFRFNRG